MSLNKDVFDLIMSIDLLLEIFCFPLIAFATLQLLLFWNKCVSNIFSFVFPNGILIEF